MKPGDIVVYVYERLGIPRFACAVVEREPSEGVVKLDQDGLTVMLHYMTLREAYRPKVIGRTVCGLPEWALDTMAAALGFDGFDGEGEPTTGQLVRAVQAQGERERVGALLARAEEREACCAILESTEPNTRAERLLGQIAERINDVPGPIAGLIGEWMAATADELEELAQQIRARGEA